MQQLRPVPLPKAWHMCQAHILCMTCMHQQSLMSHLSKNSIAQVCPMKPGVELTQVANSPGVIFPPLRTTQMSLFPLSGTLPV